MSFINFKAIPLPFIILQIALSSFTFTNAFTFNIQNNCAYTIWAAASPGGGKQLEPKSSWTTDVNPGSNKPARIWARTKCTFGSSVKGCETGDCNGVLECQASGNPPYTAAEFISGSMDFFDISLLEGFNVPMAISGCNREIKCAADINGPCPRDLKAPGGCKNPLYGF